MKIETSGWNSYPKVYNLGHPAIEDLFKDDVTVEEKVDGSQFSFGKFDGEIKCRSKGQQINIDAPEKMFFWAVETVKALKDNLEDGWTYRAEYLQKPKHNTIAYERMPNAHLIVFDINIGAEAYLNYGDKEAEANRLGLEIVPKLWEGDIFNPEMIEALLETDSILGGTKIEGIVIKNRHRFGRDGKPLFGKFVSEKFKERNSKSFKERNPGPKDIISVLIDRFRSEARWEKACQYLRDSGNLKNEDKDIGMLVKEIPDDILSECSEEIRDLLMEWAWPQIKRGVIRGMPEWYKKKLMEAQFEK